MQASNPCLHKQFTVILRKPTYHVSCLSSVPLHVLTTPAHPPPSPYCNYRNVNPFNARNTRPFPPSTSRNPMPPWRSNRHFVHPTPSPKTSRRASRPRRHPTRHHSPWYQSRSYLIPNASQQNLHLQQPKALRACIRGHGNRCGGRATCGRVSRRD